MIDVKAALDALRQIEDLAIMWGGDHGAQIRQQASFAMVALGIK